LGTKNQKAVSSKQQAESNLWDSARLLLSADCLLHTTSRGVTHPGRTVTVWERGVRRGMVGLTPRPNLEWLAERGGDTLLMNFKINSSSPQPKRRRRFDSFLLYLTG
jgi:hypothetical protein